LKLQFCACGHNKSHLIPLHGVYLDTATNTIHFDVCYDALLIVVKYLYTGLLRRYEYEDITIARDVMKLADILHLTHLSVDINGQFVSSRKRLKENQFHEADDQKTNDSVPNDDDQHPDDEWSDWRKLKLHSFDFNDWNPNGTKLKKVKNQYFLNPKVLYHFDVEMYRNIPSRQRIVIGDRHFQISKVIYVAVSTYFRAMFAGSSGLKWAESQQTPSEIMVMKGIDVHDFERLQSFLYTFDQSTYLMDSVDLNHSINSNVSSVSAVASDSNISETDRRGKVLTDTLSAWNLSIFFGIGIR